MGGPEQSPSRRWIFLWASFGGPTPGKRVEGRGGVCSPVINQYFEDLCI